LIGKLVKLYMVIVLGMMKDEQAFSNHVFMKWKLWNCLTNHLDLVVCIYFQIFYSIATFPFRIVIYDWNDNQFFYRVHDQFCLGF